MAHTTLTDKEIYPYLRKGSAKMAQLTKHLTDLIKSGQLPYGYHLKSVRCIADLTGLSIPTIYIVIDELVLRKLISKANGQVAKVIFQGARVEEDRTKFLQVGSHFKKMWRFTPGLDKYFHKAEEKHRSKFPPAMQNSIYETLTLTCCNLLNEQHNKKLNIRNVYYFHDAYLMMCAITSVVTRKSKAVIIPEQAMHLKAILKDKGIKFFEVGFDQSGLRMDEVRHICEKHKISAVYMMSIANFPNALDTSEERILQLHSLRKKHGFTIIDCSGFEPWIKEKENYVMKMVDNNLKGVIYMSPVTHVLEEIGRLVYIAAHVGVISKIDTYLTTISSSKSYSTAFATHELLVSRKFADTVKKLNDELIPLAAQIHKIFRSAGFWKTDGIRAENGAVIYLEPKTGFFGQDVFDQLEKLEISVVDPFSYWEPGTEVKGIRIDLTSFIGKKNITTALKELDRIMRSLVQYY